MAQVLPLEVEPPVRLEMAARSHGAQSQNGLGSWDAPAGAGDIEPVVDEMSAGTLDDPGRDGQTRMQVGVVVEHVALGDQIVGAVVGAVSLLGPQAMRESCPRRLRSWWGGPCILDRLAPAFREP